MLIHQLKLVTFFRFKILVCLCVLFGGIILPSSYLTAQSCNCTEYVYLNDPQIDEVHKFSVAGSGALTEIGTPWLTGLNNAHGLASDINGRLYIGEANNFNSTGVVGPVNQILCDGSMILDNDFLNPVGVYHFNFASQNGILYNPNRVTDEIIAYSLCDGSEIGRMNIGANVDGWGFYLDDTNWYFPNRLDGQIYSGALNTALFNGTNSGIAVLSTGITVSNPGFSESGLMGMTRDNLGNYYVVENNYVGDRPTVRILKFNTSGSQLAVVSDNAETVRPTNGLSGFWGARGIVYSNTSDRLYVGSRDNCVTVFNTDLVEQTALNIGNPNNTFAKGIAINSECCPNTTPLVFNESICYAGTTQNIFLQDFLSCSDGTICEGSWTEVSNSSSGNIQFFSCDLSVRVTGAGCAVFSLTKGVQTGNQQCGAFSITVNICATTDASANVMTAIGTCNGAVPNNNASINLSSAIGDRANFSLGGFYTGSGYANTANIDISSGSRSFTGLIHNTEYTVRVWGGGDACFMDYTVTTPDIVCNLPCNLTDTGKDNEVCQDANTATDPSDDFVRFRLNPTGINLGSSYSVSVSNGGTITRTDAMNASNNAYGVPIQFRLQNGSADGTLYTITITDNDDNSCQITTTVQQNTCAACPIITNPTTTQSICEGQTITSLSVNTDTNNPNQIEFVYFTSSQIGNAMYIGGTALGIISPNAGVASISNVSFPTTGTYFVYAILAPAPTDANCRPFQEIQIVVNPNPDISLMVSDPSICEGEDAPLVVFMSEIGVTYQLRDNSNNNPVGTLVPGNGGDMTIPISGLLPNNYVYNILATNGSTGCQAELTDPANVTVNQCDFPDFPPPICLIPACHIIPVNPQVYFGSGVTADPPGNGDTNANTDIDDGIGFPNNIRRNIDIRIPITFYNNTGNPVYIQGWIDWDGDMNFAANEQIANRTEPFDGGNLTQTISQLVSVSATAIQDDAVAMRFRISSDPVIINEPCGSSVCAADGEVEDYLIQVECPEEVCLPLQATIIRN